MLYQFDMNAMVHCRFGVYRQNRVEDSVCIFFLRLRQEDPIRMMRRQQKPGRDGAVVWLTDAVKCKFVIRERKLRHKIKTSSRKNWTRSPSFVLEEKAIQRRQ